MTTTRGASPGVTKAHPSCAASIRADDTAIQVNFDREPFSATLPDVLSNQLNGGMSGVSRSTIGVSDAAVSSDAPASDLVARIEEAIRSASISDKGQIDEMRVMLRTEAVGDVEVHLSLDEGQTRIEISGGPASAHFLENERSSLEARIWQATGVNVELSVIAYRGDHTGHGQNVRQEAFGALFQSSTEGRSSRERRSEGHGHDAPASGPEGRQRLRQTSADGVVGGGGRGLRL
ncbi:MAG: hypothetical protein QM651_02425 [Rhodoblastus sp.]